MEEVEEDSNEIRGVNVVMGEGEEIHFTLYLVGTHNQEQEEYPSSSKTSSLSSDNKFIILIVLNSVILVLVYQVAAYLCGDQYGLLQEGYSRYAPGE